MSAVALFLDTHAFLHFRPIEEIDWCKLSSSDSVDIVIAPVVLRELDKLKVMSEKKRIRKRADSALKKLAAFLRQSPPVKIRDGVALGFRPSDPIIDFAAHKLNDRISDDWLIATAVEFHVEFPDVRVAVAANDVGLQLKAIGQGLECVELPGEYALLEEPDPEELRIQELEKKIHDLERSAPNLRLVFANGEDRFEFRLARVPLITDAEIVETMGGVRTGCPKVPKPQLYSGADLMRGSVGPADIDRYNGRVEEYYVAYEKYLHSLRDSEDSLARLIVLDVVMLNTGYSPAENVDVYLDLPDGLRVADNAESLVHCPIEPTAPDGPKSAMQESLERLAIAPPIGSRMFESPRLANIESLGRNITEAKIRRTNSYEVHFHIRGLKHNLKANFGSLFVLFESWDTTRSFTINYRLLAANVPRPVEGQLHAIVRVAGPAESE